MPPEFGMWNADCGMPHSAFRFPNSALIFIRRQSQIGPNNFARAAVT